MLLHLRGKKYGAAETLTLSHHWGHRTSIPNPQSGTEEKLTELVIMKQLANALGAK